MEWDIDKGIEMEIEIEIIKIDNAIDIEGLGLDNIIDTDIKMKTEIVIDRGRYRDWYRHRNRYNKNEDIEEI